MGKFFDEWSMCKKVRNDRSYWESVESYLTPRLDAQITHGICPDCLAKVENEP